MQRHCPFSSLVLAATLAFQSFCALPHAGLRRDEQVITDTVTIESSLSDVHDAQATDTVDVPVDVSPDGTDMASDTADAQVNDSDVVDATAPDVQPDVVDVIVSDTVDVVFPFDSGPTPLFRYEFRILDDADAASRANDPMHLVLRDPGGGWMLVSCLNTGTDTMALVPGVPGGFRRCDVAMFYRDFAFMYDAPGIGRTTTTVISVPSCRARDGFQARILQYDPRMMMWVQLVDETGLGANCDTPYGVHQLPASAVRDF